jgi:asparagine synthase (glutamine-hydrolysing)
MCGLAFLYDRSNDDGAIRVQKSIGLLQHRGPDESNVLSKGNASLGHARLSIIDLSGSRQPMQSPDGRYVLIYNGEIYNFSELKESLEIRWRFSTHGDTEVLLAGLILEGESFISRLEGMWAFVLWDSLTESLLMSRDRMGKKPLFYTIDAQGISCASELPALRVMAYRSWSEDVDSTADYFRFGYFLPGYTAWKGVLEVLPGHWVRWSSKNKIEQRSYWQLPCPNDAMGKPNREDFINVLDAAVRKRLIADVEVGAFLSGGVDSSLICALAQSKMTQRLKTYTIGFADQAFDERKYADMMAQYIGTNHRDKELSEWDESRLELLLDEHLGQPFADSSLLPTSLVSELASHDVKVALTGDGGDELFGGYQRYQARIILRWYTRLPIKLRKYAETALRKLPEPRDHHSRSLIKKVHLFLDVVARLEDETPYIAPVMFHSNAYAELFPGLVKCGQKPPGLLEETVQDDLQRMLYADALVYLPQDILVKVDRASMAHSVETRAPLLDHKVVEMAFSIPADEHCTLGNGKRWLKQVYGDMLPSAIWTRRKQGFAVPIHRWFREGLNRKLEHLLNAAPEHVRPSSVRKLLNEHIKGDRDHGYRLWMIYVYLLNHH